MTPAPKSSRKPAIMMTRSDHASLSRLGESFANQNAELADELFVELDRARVVPDAGLRPDVVRIGSTLRFTSDTGDDRTVTLVFPGEADIAEGKISVLTPIGIALIGLTAGQAIDWTGRNGHVHRLSVQSVTAPAAALAHDLRTA